MRRLTPAFFVSMLAAACLSAATYTVTNTNDSGAGSLRQAILDSNTSVGFADTIAFDVSGAGCDGSGVCTIAPLTFLPTVSDTALIDGYTQPGSSPNTNAQGAINAVLKIVLSGVNFPGAWGFEIAAAGSTLRGLVIHGAVNQVWVKAANVTVRGCFIGTDAAGMTGVSGGRGVYGAGLSGATGLTVGGPAPADRNLIAGHTGQNIMLEGVFNGTIEGNLVGTDATGAAPILPLPNDSIVIAPAATGEAVIRGNVVAGGTVEAISIGAASDGPVTLQGNFIGTDATGTVILGNPTSGVRIFGNDVTVGGTGAGEGNVIAFNAGAGIFIYPEGATSPVRCTIRGNSIYSNHQNTASGEILGIDLGENASPLGGVTENDLGDGDTGSNNLQNFPIITSAVSSIAAGGTTISGRLNSAPGTTYTLDFYGNPACVGRPQDFREGKTYLGTDSITTDGTGNAAINTVLPVTLGDGEVVTATATDPDGNTSEFSQRIVLRSTPGSGSPSGAPITLDGFHFLSGASVTVGGVAATGVNVASYNQITATAPPLAPGSLNNVTVTNTDGSAGTLPNGWIADFLDVPGNHIFYSFVTTLVRNAITVGVGGGNYGVLQDTLRQQMAVFLLRAKYGVCYLPPPCTVPVFTDVPCSSGFAPWINELVDQGITGGCAPNLYCPTNPVLRQQMAVLLLRTFEDPGYAPPACTSATFADVPCSSPFAPWIYELVARSVTGGCGGGNYCPLAAANRGQMATFLVKTFGLQ